MELVGRDRELADVAARLRERRLVTITGPGGIGKTALAYVAAAMVGPEFELGAVAVDLTRIDNPDGVAELIAGQLGYADFESLISSPGDRPALLVLDNCEHVLDAAAAATTALLAACDMPTILATSRSPLDLPGESVFTLSHLATPAEGEADQHIASIRLFVTRARDHDVTLDEADLELAAEVCRRLDGVPLALEIAAARLRSLTLTELLSELTTRPHELARPRFRGKPSHRSVADVVGWSFDLLGADERGIFPRLGVFAGPFTASMAHAVTGTAGVDELATRRNLDELVVASLVVADTSGEVSWYRLLHPVRAVARDRLRQAGELPRIESRFVDHIVELAVGVIARATAGWDSTSLTELLNLYGNISASLRWALQHDDEPDRAMILLAVLWGVVHQAHTSEIGALGEEVLERWGDPTTPGWPDAAATVATCRYLLGDPNSAIQLALATLPRADESPFAPVTLRRVLAQAHRATRRLGEACDYFEAGAKAAVERGAHGLAMELWVDYGIVVAELGEIDTGLAVVGRTREDALARLARVNAAWALAGRGAIELRRDAGAAKRLIIEGIAESRSIGYPAGVSFGLRSLATADLQLGDPRGAAQATLDLVDELLRRGGINDMRSALDISAIILETSGNPAWADLAATAASLPVTTITTFVDHGVFERSAQIGQVLSLRDAYVTCRRELMNVIDDGAATAPMAAQAPARSDSTALVRDGDVWRFSYDGSTVTLKAVKGVDDLATLLGEPGREFSSLDLMGSIVAASWTNDEILDATARRQYEERIRELQQDIDVAESHNDLARAERLQVEFDTIVGHLTAALGLGGRSRRTANDAERARSAVTQRLRSTINRISEHHPELGAHLRSAITTGTFCSYRPSPPVTWTVKR